ncbi:protein phosphatase Slingshot homolog 1 [Anolis carolinensis]|nr:PREDICTED: protein phosphatase Slingshot homolog 1 [Anolis carolinensis]|eukprot:XP_003230085.2 PREDICTED: protein phosphatase Slingshot homolog 1 [Anolis carolinensis]
MALVTLQRSPTPSAASSSASNSELDAGSDEERRLNLSLSESFFMVKGAALFLQQGNSPQGPRTSTHLHKHAGDLPQHLQVMINLLRCEDRIKLAVRLESAWTDRVRYMVVVDSSGRQDTEENILLGVDFSSKESNSCTIGMVLRLWSDTKIHLDGDGGFSVSTAGKMHIFKPVSVQAMWSALQILYKACDVARQYNYFPGGMALVWATYYESCIASEQSCLNEWNAMQDLESTRPDSPALYVDKPTERELAERLIKAKLRSIMMSKDLENVTSKEIRNELEKHMSCNLKEFKEFIDNEMLRILGQMDRPSLIFDHLYLGSEWNASNLEELRGLGVDYILNVTREIDNFFPGMFTYHNIRVYDEETTDLLAHWNQAYHFINKAKRNRSKCLVHCKMGVSRSASTVIAYAMKEFGWSAEEAYNYVKQKRNITRPNAGFMRQLQEYQGILDASKQRHNKLWKQQPEDRLPQNVDSSNGSEDFPLDRLDTESEDFQHCFRCLSDTFPGDGEAFFPADGLQKDALLDEADLYTDETDDLPFLGSSSKSEAENPTSKVTVEEKKGHHGAGGWKDTSGAEDGEEPLERWKRHSSDPEEESRTNNESPGSNHSKRSCPEDFEHDAVFGILSKVKPSYKPCGDCIYSSAGDVFAEPCARLPPPPPPCRSPVTVCTQPSFPPVLEEEPKEIQGTKPNSLPLVLAAGDTPGSRHAQEGALLRKDLRSSKDLKHLLFSKDPEKPTATSYLMQHQESLLQLQKAGLVRKHTKELERLKSTSGAAADMTIPEEPQEVAAHPDKAPPLCPSLSRDAGNDAEKLRTTPPAAGPSCKTEHSSGFSKDFLKTICYTPPSSSRSSNLTRSSSSDSIHSVRGKPGLVKQRTQEIETRLRLAGLTVSSPLKRSNSLAKLGSLNLSSEDLAGDGELSALASARETQSGEPPADCNFRLSPKNTEEGAKLKPTPGKLKDMSWLGKS